MTTTIGDRERFAIEFDADADSFADQEEAEWMFGNIRWWCGGKIVGNYEQYTSLRDVSIDARNVLERRRSRPTDELMAESKEAVVRIVSEAIFIDHGQTDEELERDEARFRHLIVDPGVSAFDPWVVFLIANDSVARLIWRQHEDSTVYEQYLKPGEFESVLEEFLQELSRVVGQSV